MIHAKVAVTCNMILNILESSDSDSSDEDELLLVTSQSCLRQKLTPRTKRYMEGAVYLMTDVMFKSHFRMRRDTFTILFQMIGERLNKQSVRYGRNPIPPEKQLLLALWTMATPDSYRSICDRFDVGKATGWRTVRRVVDALYRLRKNVIKWPDAMTARKTWEYILNKYGFPKVLGAIDGTHIKIAAPKLNHEAYINRKGFHSIQLQVVCDEHLRLIHVYAGEVGSVHDARVFRLSGLQNYCSPDYFPEDSHLLGDAAYGIQKHVMVPYKCHAHLEADCVRYNAIHSSSRIMIERSIGLLKGRFRSLMDVLPMKRTDLIPRYIVACCVLHNICINANDLIDIPIIVNDEVISPLPREVNDNTRCAGIQKRDAIKCQLCH